MTNKTNLIIVAVVFLFLWLYIKIEPFYENEVVVINTSQDSFHSYPFRVITKGNNYNEELQYYHNDNVYINNGNLILEARKEEYKNHIYTSGKITTESYVEFLYGEVEIRMKHPKGDGCLSAIWLLPIDEIIMPEIDVVEVLGSKPNELWSVLHYSDQGIQKREFETIEVEDEDAFHIYKLKWSEDVIAWYVNDAKVMSLSSHIPDVRMYLLINLAIGGIWPKDPQNTDFPVRLEIDYIKVCPENEECIWVYY